MMIFLEDIIYIFICILIYKFIKLIRLLLEILVPPKVFHQKCYCALETDLIAGNLKSSLYNC